MVRTGEQVRQGDDLGVVDHAQDARRRRRANRVDREPGQSAFAELGPVTLFGPLVGDGSGGVDRCPGGVGAVTAQQRIVASLGPEHLRQPGEIVLVDDAVGEAAEPSSVTAADSLIGAARTRRLPRYRGWRCSAGTRCARPVARGADAPIAGRRRRAPTPTGPVGARSWPTDGPGLAAECGCACRSVRADRAGRVVGRHEPGQVGLEGLGLHERDGNGQRPGRHHQAPRGRRVRVAWEHSPPGKRNEH